MAVCLEGAEIAGEPADLVWSAYLTRIGILSGSERLDAPQPWYTDRADAQAWVEGAVARHADRVSCLSISGLVVLGAVVQHGDEQVFERDGSLYAFVYKLRAYVYQRSNQAFVWQESGQAPQGL